MKHLIIYPFVFAFTLGFAEIRPLESGQLFSAEEELAFDGEDELVFTDEEEMLLDDEMIVPGEIVFENADEFFEDLEDEDFE